MEFVGDSAKVLIGITTQRVLSIVMIPLIAWLLGPMDYGIFNISASICTLCSVIGGLSLEASIAISGSKQQALARVTCTSLFGILSGLLFLVIAWYFRSYLLRYYSSDAVKALFWMIPFFVPLAVMSIAMQNYVAYLGHFGFIALADVASSVANYMTLISAYFLLFGDYRALIVASLLAFTVRIIIFLKATWNIDLSLYNILHTEIRKELWDLRHFIKFNLSCNILNTANVQLPPAFISIKYPENMVGLFVMARNIITIPSTLSGQALGQVFYPKAAKEYRNGHGLQNITWQTFIHSCQLTIFPTIFIASTAGFLLPMVLGPKWNGVAIYILLLLPMVLLNAIQTQIGIGFIFNILNQQHKILLGNLILSICRIGPLVVFLFIISIHVYLTIFSYSIGSAMGYAILLIWIFIATSISVSKAFSIWLKNLLLALFCVLPILFSFLNNKSPYLVVYLLSSVLLYGFVVWFVFLNNAQRELCVDKTYKSFLLLKKIFLAMTKLL
jgi:O-antigen/teichoic acid export membrane protein